VLERQRVGDGGHHVRVPAQRALACHPARSASLGRIFTHTARPALMTRRWRWGGLRGHSPPPAPPSGDTGIGSAMGWMNLNYASPPAFTSRLVCYPSTFGDPKGNILRMSSAIDFNPVGREKAADAIAPIPGLMEAPAAPREGPSPIGRCCSPKRLPLPSVAGIVTLSAMTIRADDWAVATRLASAAPKERVRSTTAETTWAVYLDYNASAPLDPRAAEAMVSVLTNVGNATSAHGFGRRQAALVDRSREQVAALVGSRPSNVVFTASATEANNLAICGAVQAAGQDQFRILVSAVEHPSVFRTADWLRARGAVRVDVIPVTRGGVVDLGAVERLLGPDVLLVSVMAANGETGVVNPIAEVAELAHDAGSLFHCDATQFAGRMPLSMDDVGVDLVSVSAHKLGGPMGVGALIGTRRSLARLAPVIHGGGHERGLRSGSLNVPGIVGFGEAAALAVEVRAEESIRLARLRDFLTARLIAAVPGVVQIGDVERRLPNTACLRFRNADAEAVIVNLEPVAASTGSACSAGSIEPSHVLLAMGLSRSAAFECVRFSLGRSTVDTDIDFSVSRAVQAVRYVRQMTAEAV